MDFLKINTDEFIGKEVGEWRIHEVQDQGITYVFILKKESNDKIFFIRKGVIKGKHLNLETDVYELWYYEFKEAKLLTLSQIMDTNIVIEEMNNLIKKCSKFEK